MKGKVFLDQNNEHGDVLGQFENISPDDCIDKENGICYLNKVGNYLQNE
jgi:hypothetical protein